MIKFDAKFIRFDDKKLLRMVDRSTRKAMSKFGAFVMQTAKRSIRDRKNPSKPGKPPTNQTGRLKEFIWFGYEYAAQTVVIGPAKLWSGGPRALETLEYGGTGTVYERRFRSGGKWYPWNRNYSLKKGQEGRSRQISVAARPFMHPAFEKEKSKLPQLWRDSIQ